MSQLRRKRSTLDLGHDAFLDIVANLVGILIILVVVLGTQSSEVIEEIREQATVDSVAPPESGRRWASKAQIAELATQSMRAAAAQEDSNRLERLVKRYDAQVDQRQQERDLLLDLLSEAQAAWEAKRQQLDQRTILLARQQSEVQRQQETLQQLRGERKRLEDQPEPVVAVQHLPTPMAKTVFGDEVHFRLKENRLSVVPIEKLVGEIKQDFQRAAPGTSEGQLDGAVGPVRGYVARYVMDKNRQMVSRGGRVQMATRIQLVGLTLEPLREPHGQSIDEVMVSGSELDIELAGRDPNTTTITVWVYPDSFAAFRMLKERLYQRGFATAARPLPPGQPITGSPAGSRSRAQ